MTKTHQGLRGGRTTSAKMSVITRVEDKAHRNQSATTMIARKCQRSTKGRGQEAADRATVMTAATVEIARRRGNYPASILTAEGDIAATRLRAEIRVMRKLLTRGRKMTRSKKTWWKLRSRLKKHTETIVQSLSAEFIFRSTKRRSTCFSRLLASARSETFVWLEIHVRANLKGK